MTSESSAGDVIEVGSQVIEVRVAELRQLFNAIDPSPFRERDLDPRAEEFTHLLETGEHSPRRRAARRMLRRVKVSCEQSRRAHD